jgi:hypothetical protein
MNHEFNLIKAVIENSESETFAEACSEWNITNYNESESNTDCICGKKHIKYCYIIKNRITKECLYPIGSECIKKFGSTNMNECMARISDKFKVFVNKDKKHDGKTYDYICRTDEKYVIWLRDEYSGSKKKFEKLVNYYTFTKLNNTM